jgi:CheY-like chemotaxis protein
MQDTVEGAPVRGALEQAMEAAVTTSDLCRRLLNYAKGRRSAKRACEVKDLLLQAEAITGFGSNVTCEHFVRPGLWPVLADGIQIVQVINNLLVNAQQAMPEGGMIALLAENVAPESHLPQGLPPGDYVAIKVRDRGVGIPEEKQKRIFEALYTTKADGSGLGLATCAQIVSAHQGFIDVHSVPSRGSEFTVYLPAATAAPVNGVDSEEPSAMENADAAVPPSTSVASQLKILVVEDQLGIRKIAQACLEKLGHEVVCAESGEKALALHREAWGSGDRFDLGLIDMTLPGGMNGEDTFRELCNVDPHLIGIATSGSIDAESLPLYQRKGFAAILPKPFPLRLLGEVVEEAMQFHTV